MNSIGEKAPGTIGEGHAGARRLGQQLNGLDARRPVQAPASRGGGRRVRPPAGAMLPEKTLPRPRPPSWSMPSSSGSRRTASSSPASTASRSGSPKPLGRPTPTAGRRLDDQALVAYLAELHDQGRQAEFFQSMDPAGRRLTGRALERRVVLAMIKRRTAAAGLPPSTCCTRSGRWVSRRTCRTGEPSSTPSRSRDTVAEDDAALRPDGDTVTVDEILAAAALPEQVDDVGSERGDACMEPL